MKKVTTPQGPAFIASISSNDFGGKKYRLVDSQGNTMYYQNTYLWWYENDFKKH